MLENAKFITTANPKDSVSPVFRREFSCSKPLRAATLTVTARGAYEAFLNGRRVGDFILAPGFTSYNHRIQVQTYDITEAIAAENTCDILLGNGWHYGELQRGVYEKVAERAVIAELKLVYADGSAESIVTDSTWQTAKSGILYSDIYNGETFDANVVYGDWQNAVEAPRTGVALIPQESEPVREAETVPAVGLIITPKGERVIDFGQEVTGYVCFRTVGEIGARTVLAHGEMLDKDGNFYNANYRAARSLVTYITDGNTENWYHPHFSFQGFRYIKLAEYPTDDIYIGDFYAIAVHTDMKRTGFFECSDPLVNRLYENVIWGQRGNFLDIPTDCPQRDERLGWTGDAQVFCRTAAYNYDVQKFYRKWLRDLALDQSPNGAVPEVVPMVWGDIYAFAWSDAATVCPWEIYRAYGDASVLQEQFASMQGWVDYLHSKGDSPAEWASGKQYGDWLGLDGTEDDVHGATDNELLATAFFFYSCGLLIKAGKVLGKEIRAYEALQAHLGEVFRTHFIGADGLLTCDTQTAYAVALRFGLIPEAAQRAKFAAHLAEKLHANGDRLQTGFIGTAYLMDALTENGYADVAYSLLLQKEFPSWLYSVRKGATTVWEHWDGLKPDGTMWSEGMNSFNHYAYGAVASWLYGTVAGIQPTEEQPGYAHIRICPIPDARLSYAKASIETKFGTVSCGWRKTATGFAVSAEIPQGATADLYEKDGVRRVSAGHYEYTL